MRARLAVTRLLIALTVIHITGAFQNNTLIAACVACTQGRPDGWCPSSGLCLPGTQSGPTAPGTCLTTADAGPWTWSHDDCYNDYPSTAFNCEECLSLTGAGWCSATRDCLYGTPTGPWNGTCTASGTLGGWMYWNASGSGDGCECVDPAATLRSCAACTQGCPNGWCASDSHCYAGTKDGGPWNGTCADWVWYNADCA